MKHGPQKQRSVQLELFTMQARPVNPRFMAHAEWFMLQATCCGGGEFVY